MIPVTGSMPPQNDNPTLEMSSRWYDDDDDVVVVDVGDSWRFCTKNRPARTVFLLGGAALLLEGEFVMLIVPLPTTACILQGLLVASSRVASCYSRHTSHRSDPRGSHGSSWRRRLFFAAHNVRAVTVTYCENQDIPQWCLGGAAYECVVTVHRRCAVIG